MKNDFDTILRRVRMVVEAMMFSWLSDSFQDSHEEFEGHIEEFKSLAAQLIDAAEAELNFLPGNQQ